ncbi:MAG: hypothetical protein RL682_30, partial [Pseudomonadota bacterium]
MARCDLWSNNVRRLAGEGDNVVHLWADANPLANTVVMVARNMGHD